MNLPFPTPNDHLLVGHDDSVIPLGAVLVVLALPVADLVQHVVAVCPRVFGVVDLLALKHNLGKMKPYLVTESRMHVPEWKK